MPRNARCAELYSMSQQIIETHSACLQAAGLLYSSSASVPVINDRSPDVKDTGVVNHGLVLRTGKVQVAELDLIQADILH